MKTLLNSGLGLLVGLIWLLVLGAYQEFEPKLGALFASAVLATFVLLHLVQKRPTAWTYQRLQIFDRKHLPLSLLLVLLLTTLQVSLFANFAQLPTPTLAVAGNTNAAHSLTLLAAVAILAAPIIEEFGFRLWLQTPLEALLKPWLAIIASSLLFTAVHGLDGWYSHLLSGLVYGTALWLSGSIWLPILMHAASNLLIALLNASDTVTSILRHWMVNEAELLPMLSAVLAVTTLICAALWVRSFTKSELRPA